jgi:hypothetical protein
MTAFWNSPSTVEPKRAYRFFIQNGEGTWWWAKTAQKPSVDISEGMYKVGNSNLKYPGIATWNDISITIVDEKQRAQKLYKVIQESGYSPVNAAHVDGFSKTSATQALLEKSNFLIQQIDSEGSINEEWVLYNPWIKSISFSDLDYSSDELSTIDLTITYDYAIITNEVT